MCFIEFFLIKYVDIENTQTWCTRPDANQLSMKAFIENPQYCQKKLKSQKCKAEIKYLNYLQFSPQKRENNIFQLEFSSQSLQFQNVTDPILATR